MEADLSNVVTACPGCSRDVLLSLDICPHCDTPADSRSEFVSFRYPTGGGGAADQMTVAFLRSKHHEPNSQDLPEQFATTTRVRLSELVFRDHHGKFEPVLEIASPAQISTLMDAMSISPEPCGHAMTIESHRVELFAGDDLVATVALIETYLLRWEDRWRSDARVADPARLADFFASQGYPKMRETLDARCAFGEQRAREHERWLSTWTKHSHPVLLELVDDLVAEQLMPDSQARRRALAALSEHIPDTQSQIRLLLGWYGHSQGPWSPCPADECAPQSLLQEFSNPMILNAISADVMTPMQVEGAIRYFAHWGHPGQRNQGEPVFPPELKALFLAHLEKSGDEEKIRWAKPLLDS